jgi:hypothetical protein
MVETRRASRGQHVSRIEAATLTRIKCRFAGRERAAERAFEASESFRGLCRDYLACTATLARWQELESEEARRRSAEYAELMAELTREIEAHLHAHER